MKKLIFIVMLFISVSATAQTSQTSTKRDSTTNETYIVKSTGQKLAVYIGQRGGKYVWRKSESGKMYKQYLKK